MNTFKIVQSFTFNFQCRKTLVSMCEIDLQIFVKGGTIFMTNNQIQYWKLQQDRANLLEQRRHNIETERIGSNTLQETARHNIAGESQASSVLQETARHNVANEQLDIGKLSETGRHNVETESIQNAANLINRFRAQSENANRKTELYEQQRSNRSKESETRRHNLSQEALTEFKNVVDQTYNQAMIRDRERGRELEAQKLEDQWNEWTRQFELNRDKYATSLDQWQREQLTDNVHWGVGEISDLFQSFLRFGSKSTRERSNYNEQKNKQKSIN